MSDIEAAVYAIAAEAAHNVVLHTDMRVEALALRVALLEQAATPPDVTTPPPDVTTPPDDPSNSGPPDVPDVTTPPPPVAGEAVAHFGMAAPVDEDTPSRTVASWGQSFLPGSVHPDTALEWRTGAYVVPVQVDAVTYHPDSSIAVAILAAAAPAAIAAGTRMDGLLHIASAAPAMPIGDLAAQDIRITVERADGSRSWSPDLASLRLRRAGPHVTGWHGMIETPPGLLEQDGMRLDVEAQIRSDGSTLVRVTCRHDAMEVMVAANVEPGTKAPPPRYDTSVNYRLRVEIGGEVLLDSGPLLHWLYGTWGRTVVRAPRGRAYPAPDVALMSESGLIPPYDGSAGWDEDTKAKTIARLALPAPPLSTGYVRVQTGGPGNRGDIGWLPEWSARVFTTDFDPIAVDNMLAQSEAAAGMPLHFFDRATGRYVNRHDYPGFWNSTRGTIARPINYTDPAATTWRIEYAHQPEIGLAAFVCTGLITWLEEIVAQGFAQGISSTVAGAITNPRYPEAVRAVPPRDSLVIVHTGQVREVAWLLRSMTNAAFLCPWWRPYDAALLRDMQAAQVGWWQQQAPHWREHQGEAFGRIMCAGMSDISASPWQNDHVANAIAIMGKRGVAGVAELAQEFFANWYLGRFEQPEAVFPFGLGCCAKVAIVPLTDTGEMDETAPFLRTWAEMGAATTPAIAGGPLPWGEQANYPRLGCQAVAMFGWAFPALRDRAVGIWDRLRAHPTIPFVAQGNYAREATNAMSPPGRALF